MTECRESGCAFLITAHGKAGRNRKHGAKSGESRCRSTETRKAKRSAGGGTSGGTLTSGKAPRHTAQVKSRGTRSELSSMGMYIEKLRNTQQRKARGADDGAKAENVATYNGGGGRTVHNGAKRCAATCESGTAAARCYTFFCCGSKKHKMNGGARICGTAAACVCRYYEFLRVIEGSKSAARLVCITAKAQREKATAKAKSGKQGTTKHTKALKRGKHTTAAQVFCELLRKHTTRKRGGG